MKRTYEDVIRRHFSEHQQMVLLSGARQVGKTTLACTIESGPDLFYLNWDDADDRELLLRGTRAIAQRMGLERLRARLPLLVLDEIHKFSKWKQLLKGFYDKHHGQCRILVTGSARLDV